jgi:uncharacterized C2H2 Zn-finger protein
MSTKKSPAKHHLFSCENCNYNTNSSKDYNKHVLTRKHIKTIPVIQKVPENPTIRFQCVCGKIYKERTGIWRHKQICKQTCNQINNLNTIEEPSIEIPQSQPSTQVDMSVVIELLNR